MLFLIDGYNLMHAMGYVSPKMNGTRFQHARESFLGYLDEMQPKQVEFLVIFDGTKQSRRSQELRHGRIRVQFSHGEFADDTIESHLQRYHRSMNWTLVSNDTRLHESARRRDCRFWGHEAFLDWLIAAQAIAGSQTIIQTISTPVNTLKPETVPEHELEHWLKAFEMPVSPRRN
ncbi:NYN domain-containing protein [Tuwongella immobilis]|uniref:NYN domain-containing protein n=1 Tax=Tuwongella immobilis TaxID=692036 RepID=A0A6C2YPA8_9BACT|nr:NYN domain-containing protein [Tuwongella immobilis]VIP03276.1 Uncharacterized protein OS=Isosphaera pallida (strain ATCC 43644 / DSM 9630 / IS1B) GN=Isop_0059 PE=4 SV=1: NYN_YacP [Tuwongella immobilis]VTS03915.1 Uncharacterized protein OS=Isosphaera pallida (strain ATCC 43644 / DSM 9630 / IS1B) GN=Isop_0059 PE=4 SV=1: NYN_YacP [Tuwongella immobilis]